MGHDKTAIPLPFWGGESLLQWAVERISGICSDWVVADGGKQLCPGTVSINDGPGAGPAAGILGAAERCPGRSLLVLACDLPLVPASSLAVIAGLAGDWVAPVTAGGPEPLCALYAPPALAALRVRVDRGKLSLRDLAEGNPTLDVHRIQSRVLVTDFLGERELESIGGADTLFANINRPADLERLKDLSRFAVLRRRDFLRAHSTRG